MTFDKFEGFGHINMDQPAARVIYDEPDTLFNRLDNWLDFMTSQQFWRNVWRFLQESW